MKVLLERVFPIRYVEKGTIELNGMPDYRYSKSTDYYNRKWFDMYTCSTTRCNCLTSNG